MISESSCIQINYDEDDEVSVLEVLKKIGDIYQFKNPSMVERYPKYDQSWRQLIDALEHFIIYMEDENRRGLNLTSSMHIPRLLVEDIIVKSTSNVETILKESITVRLEEVVPFSTNVESVVRPDYDETLFPEFQKNLQDAYNKVLPLGANLTTKNISNLLGKIEGARKQEFTNIYQRLFIETLPDEVNVLNSIVSIRNKIAHNLNREIVQNSLLPIIAWYSFEVSRMVYIGSSVDRAVDIRNFTQLSEFSGKAHLKAIKIIKGF